MKIDSRIFDIDPNVKQLSDKVLIDQTDLVTATHRGLTVLVLRHLREVEVRRLFVDMGYPSMHKCCIKRYKFSENETQRWLDSARLMTELPEIETQVESGALNVTNLYKLQSFVRAEKAVDHKFTREEKLELVAEMENKPTRQVERELIQKSHQPALLAEKFHLVSQVLSGSLRTLANLNSNEPSALNPIYSKFEALLDSEHRDLMEEFINLYGNELQDRAAISILSFLLKRAVNEKKKKLGLMSKKELNALPPCTLNAETSNAPETTQVSLQIPDKGLSIPTSQSKPINSTHDTEARPKFKSARKPLKVSVKKAVWGKAQGCCEHQDKESKARCSSKFALQPDHIVAIALGGTDELSNLQLLCRAHNFRRSIKTFGVFRR